MEKEIVEIKDKIKEFCMKYNVTVEVEMEWQQNIMGEIVKARPIINIRS